MTLTEALVATFVVSTLGILCLTMVATGTAARRQDLSRQAAILEAENILQRLAALDPQTLNLQAGEPLPAELLQQLENRLQARLPGARLEVEVRHVAAPLAGRHIAVAIHLPARGPAVGPAVRLSTWLYLAPEGPP